MVPRVPRTTGREKRSSRLPQPFDFAEGRALDATRPQREDLVLLGPAAPGLGAPRHSPHLAVPDVKISVIPCVSPEN